MPVSRRVLLVAAGVFFAVAFFHWSSVVPSQGSIRTFVARDLERAAGLLSGKWIWHGPETMGGEGLPGPLYYFLLLIPAASGMPYETALVQTIAFGAAGVALLATWVLSVWGWVPSLLAFLSLTLSWHVTGELIQNWNASLNVFFHSVLTILFCECFATRATQKRKGLFFAFGLFTGLSIQIHMTALLPMAILLVLALFRDRRMIPMLLAGLALPLLPWSIWRLSRPAGLLLNAIRVLEKQAVRTPIPRLDLLAIYQIMRNPLAALCLLSLPWGLKKIRAEPKLLALGVLTLMTFAIAFPYLGSPVADRYAGFFQRSLPLSCGILFGIALSQTLHHRAIRFLIPALLVITALQTSLYRTHFQNFLPLGPQEIATLTYGELKQISRMIIGRTGWDYETARRRIFTLGMDREVAFSVPYHAAWNERLESSNVGSSEISGFIVVASTKPLKANEVSVFDSSQLPKEIGLDIQSGDIVLRRQVPAFPRLWLIPYFSGPNSAFHYGFHNLKSSDHPEPIPIESARTPDFSWDLCSPELQCPVYFRVEDKRLTPGRRRIVVEVTGDSLSRNSMWETLGAVEVYRDLYLRGDCDGIPMDLPLASALGSNFIGSRFHTKPLLAPFKKVLVVNCGKPFRVIGAGYKQRKFRSVSSAMKQDGPRFLSK